MQIQNDEIMRTMAKMAMEQATTFFADMADRFSDEIPSDTTGPQALKAFADAIRASNGKIYPRSEAKS